MLGLLIIWRIDQTVDIAIKDAMHGERPRIVFTLETDQSSAGAWSRGMIFASHLLVCACERSRVQIPMCPNF